MPQESKTPPALAQLTFAWREYDPRQRLLWGERRPLELERPTPVPPARPVRRCECGGNHECDACLGVPA